MLDLYRRLKCKLTQGKPQPSQPVTMMLVIDLAALFSHWSLIVHHNSICMLPPSLSPAAHPPLAQTQAARCRQKTRARHSQGGGSGLGMRHCQQAGSQIARSSVCSELWMTTGWKPGCCTKTHSERPRWAGAVFGWSC